MKKISLSFLVFSLLVCFAAEGVAAQKKKPQPPLYQKNNSHFKTYEFTGPSTVSFNAYAFLHDFKGETSNIKGRFELDLDQLNNPGRGTLEIDASSLNTRNRQRNK